MKRRRTLQGLILRSKSYLKYHSPTILTCMGVIGVVATAVMTVKATPKAMKRLEMAENDKGEKLTNLEVIFVAGPAFIPATIVGLSTISCILGANVLNKRNQASLVSAYALLNQSYQQYRNAAKAVYGEDADEKIKIEAAKNVYVSANGCYIYDPESESEEILFYDTFGQRYFTSTMSSVINAQYHVNRNFALRGWSNLNELYDFLGLEKHRGGDLIGWSADEMSDSGLAPWIEFENRLVKMDDGLECYLISTLYGPIVLNSDDY